MEKRKLSAIPRETASKDVVETAKKLSGMKHIITARLAEENKILLLNFYEIRGLIKGNTDAAFRTFISRNDYITQDLSTSKVRWKTASFMGMNDFSFWESKWDGSKYKERDLVSFFTDEERNIVSKFLNQYSKNNDKNIWNQITSFQNSVMEKKLEARHKKETDAIDKVMENVKPVPEKFFEWAHEKALCQSQYLFYRQEGSKKATCECSCCKNKFVVDRAVIRLRNNEKGICPSCGKNVTFKAKGKISYRIHDARWAVYIESTESGFIWRYFRVYREFIKDNVPKYRQGSYEYVRMFYKFTNGKAICDSYEYTEFKQSGKTRWCHDEGKINYGPCTLYPNNLPEAWEHTPMKYSALEILSENIPGQSLNYVRAIDRYIEFPYLEWFCKMGLNELAADIIDHSIGRSNGRLNFAGKTIYEILKVNKINAKILQEIDGNSDVLRLLQVAQTINLNIKPEQLREYYETFGCNTDLLKQANRKVSLHKLIKYISKESEKYPIGRSQGCSRYAYNTFYEKDDPRAVRKQNMAKDWLDYLGWCKELKYDLKNMFIYMPTNFRKVHDRTYKEYQELLDTKAAAEKKRREKEAKKRMQMTQKAIEEIFEMNTKSEAFSIKGKGLALVVPHSGEEIKAEGEKLHHCVGGYIDRVARGDTSIFFIRKADELNVPYYTLEWKDNRIVQCRGLRNCSTTPEVEAFIKVFEKKMLESINKEGKNARNKKKQNLQSA